MIKENKKMGVFLLSLAAVPLVLIGSQTHWWDQFLPKKSPQVVEGTLPVKEPVKVHPEVLNIQESFAQVAQAVKPAVVNISAVQIKRFENDPHEFFFGDPNDFFYRFFQNPHHKKQPREFKSEGTGSGVLIDPDGFVLTNNHVVQGADQLTVTLSDGKEYKGKLIGSDERTDLAVVKIASNKKFPFAPLGNSEAHRVGDWVLAIGSPFGLEQTVTSGIISAIRQSLNIEGKNFQNLIQTDAAINRGNSGGPLVNLKGEVIGINTAIYAPTGVFSGVGFAIPVNRVKSILSDLIKKGYVERSWMGVEIAPLDEIFSRQFGLKDTEGVLVNKVLNDSPAEKAGFKRGDVILEFDGKKVKNVHGLQDVVSGTPPGKEVKVKIVRDKKPTTLKLITESLPQDGPSDSRNAKKDKQGDSLSQTEWLGATFSDLSESLRRRYGIGPEVAGVLANEVSLGSQAAEAGIREGDVIKSINGDEIKSVIELENNYKKLDLKKGVVFDVVREGRFFFMSYKSLE